jgi:ribosomal-protein-alanine N-acetyltransferase
LVLEFMATARQNGAARAFLEVAADNSPAIALYHTCGFAKAGLRRAYYHTAQGAMLDALVLSCPLLPQSPEI